VSIEHDFVVIKTDLEALARLGDLTGRPNAGPLARSSIARLARIKEEMEQLEQHFTWVQDSSVPICPFEIEVERLRELVSKQDTNLNFGQLYAEAFEEAERLRAALKRIVNCGRPPEPFTRDADSAYDIARQALEEVERV
jgi:hypothetical protein